MSVHIEGMGWLGSALAFRLDAEGIPFTWHDTEARHVAWKACTGLCYPAGDALSQDNLLHWGEWLAAGYLPQGTVAPVAYTYNQRRPPHDGTYSVTDLGWARIAQAPCYAVNVPRIVAAARQQFASARRPEPPPGARTVIAHGFNPRMDITMWGWSARVRMRVPAELRQAAGGLQSAFYSRPNSHPFKMFYAYPCPGEPGWWWAGSALVRQRVPKQLDPGPHVTRWMRVFAEMFPPVTVEQVGAVRQGWRPRPAETDLPRVEEGPDGTLTFPPLWHSGVRWAPLIVNDALRRLQAQA